MTPVDPGPNSPVSEIELPGEYHLEYHGPYLQGSGFPAVNGEQYTTITSNQLEDIRSDRTKHTSYGAGKAPLSLAPTAIPLQVQRTTNVIGPQYKNVGHTYASIKPASTCNGFQSCPLLTNLSRKGCRSWINDVCSRCGRSLYLSLVWPECAHLKA